MNPNLTAANHRWAVALLPLVTGVAAWALKVTTDQQFNPTSFWLLGNAVVTGLITVYMNYVRGTSPQ